MRRMTPFAILIACVLFAQAALAATFYIAANGSDTNNGTSNTTAWLHAPGMQGATGNASSYTPRAGDSFVFRGCDTWIASGSVFLNISASGTSGNYISYGGLDQTWYNTSVCPNGWNRPVFSGAGSWPGSGSNYKFIATPGSHIQIEWIEFTGGYTTTSGSLTSIDPNIGSDIQIFSNYWHSMNASSLSGSAASFAASSNSCGSGGAFHDNYVDMSDSSAYTQGVWQGVALSCFMDLYRNYFSNLMTCANGNYLTVHDNWFNSCGIPATANGLHANNFESNGDAPSGSLYYNNLSTNVVGASPIQFQIGPPAGATTYVFNNVAVNAASSSAFFSCSNGISSSPGTCQEFNNTVECGNDPSPAATCSENGDKSSPYPTVNSFYNHYITAAATLYLLRNGTTINATGDLQQAVPANGYTSSNDFAPTSSNSFTVGKGGAAGTMQNYCSAIGNVFGSQHQAACLHDTTLGVAINTTTHQIAGLRRTAISRPATGNWDAGAYQYSGSSSSVAAPTNVVAVVR